ncbi:MAG: tRNA uridine-5-carboxymethylaminomethyl(34) synthesis GTPase MnmE [Pseudomonadales bacterium]|nr:tRNA uridine-5-carboxymethylaminomethyl(34) synthesis GTPase MnmE [Pseudomonadales bacterium]
MMPQHNDDTICAIVTAPGRSGVGIVRLSGHDALDIALQMLPLKPEPRHAHYCSFLNGEGQAIDQGIVLYFPTPNSYTGEEVVEFQGHGGLQVLNLLLERCRSLGARLALPGEFSERAFLNNKIDLVQAEAIADLIDSASQQAARSAMRTLQGEFSRRINDLVERITTIRINVEAAIDFSDEDIDVMEDTGVALELAAAQRDLDHIIAQARQGALLKDGMSIVIAGKPNAGKSSLLNALSGQDSAIVTDIPGTTRDLLQQEITLSGMPVHITDTAGLRHSDDLVEQEGVRRARLAMQTADQILLVVDAKTAARRMKAILEPLELNKLDDDQLEDVLKRTTVILNKIDLLEDSHAHSESTSYQGVDLTVIRLSVQENLGINLLKTHLQNCVGFKAANEGSFVARERHITALKSAEEYLKKAIKGVSESSQLELIAEDLRLAQRHLGEITGEMTSDDLLGKIFSSFCVGK